MNQQQTQQAPAPTVTFDAEAMNVFQAAMEAHDRRLSEKAPVPVVNGEIMPADLDGIWRVAKWLHAANMLPNGITKVEQVALIVAKGMQIGIGPIQALENIMVVNNRCVIWGDLAIALVRSARDAKTGNKIAGKITETFDASQSNPGYTCSIERFRDDGTVETITRSFTRFDAEQAGLWGKAGPWKQYWKRMLQMRARAYAIRDGFSDVLKGLGVAEEVQDYEFAPTPTAKPKSGTQSDAATRMLEQLAQPQPNPLSPPVQAGAGEAAKVAVDPAPAQAGEGDAFGDEMAELMDAKLQAGD